MYTLVSEISIGGKLFKGLNSVQINRSVNNLFAEAIIKVPVTAVLKNDSEKTFIETAKAIKIGDKVIIKLGYNNSLNTEFVGFVKQLDFKTPLEIVCEDAFYLTREKNIVSEGRTTLKNFLQKSGLQVAYATDLALSNFAIDNKPLSWVLGKLKDEYGLCIFFDLEGRIYAAEKNKVTSGQGVKYELRKNVIKDDNLIYLRAEDTKIKIKAVCYYKDGSRIEASAGDDGGAETELFFYDVESQKELAVLAKTELLRRCYDGYRGTIETFLLPFAAPCYLAQINDPVFPQRSGRCYIEAVETSFSMQGARRKVELGIKM